MDKNEIKDYLRENPENIKKILEALGCDYVKMHKERITSTRPGGDNKTAVSVKLNNSLSTSVYTDNQFKDNENNDFFAVIEYFKECNFNEAIRYVCKICNLRYSGSKKIGVESSGYNFLKQYVQSLNKNKREEYIEKTLDEETINRFVKCNSVQYENDGVSELTQEKFELCYDVLDNRIITPIRNDDGKLITFKGRTCNKDYKMYGIPKFLYYYPFHGERYLYGLYENYFDILNADKVFIFESEKAVMQCDSMGFNNAVSVSKKTISDIQVKKLLKLGKALVVAFDKDVTLGEIEFECKKFNGLTDVYYIYDTLDLLDKKESPTDKGVEVFKKLIENCVFKYKK